MTYGVRPLVAMPTRTSAFGERDLLEIVDRQCRADLRRLRLPSAAPRSRRRSRRRLATGCELNVGGHSTASSTPSRPDVPAPI